MHGDNLNESNIDEQNGQEELNEEISTKEDLNEDSKMFPHKYIKKLRRECSRYRTALKEIQQQYEGFPPESVEEYKKFKEAHERRQEEEISRKGELKAKKIDALIAGVAETSNAIAPDQIAVLLRTSIDIDDDGLAFVLNNNEASVKDFVESFLQDNLHLVRSKSKRKGANTNPFAANIFSVEQISNMTAEQYKRNRDRILKSLSKNV